MKGGGEEMKGGWICSPLFERLWGVNVGIVGLFGVG